jgi:hypothetical protein
VPGSDIVEHIAYPMRLNLSLFVDHDVIGFLKRVLAFNHGYTQISVLFVLYKVVFGVLGAPINEFTLAAVHSGIGIASLLVVFLFLRRFIEFADALLIVAVLAVTPIHVGISAANSGYQLFKMIGVYLSLARLDAWCRAPSRRNMAGYALALLFAIGAGTDFLLTLLLNLLYAYWIRSTPACEEARRARLWTNGWIIALGWTPCLVMIGVGVYAALQDLPIGVLHHFHSTVSVASTRLFTPLEVFRSLAIMVGPLALAAPVALVLANRWRKEPWTRTIALQWGIEFLVLAFSRRAQWTSHILNLAVPSLVLAYLVLRSHSWGRPVFAASGLMSVLLMLNIIFGIGGAPIRTTYGTRHYSETGVQALGFVVRSDLIPVERNPDTGNIALAVDLEGAWFYLGANTFGQDDLAHGVDRMCRNMTYVYRPGIDSPFNKLIGERVRTMPVTLEIVDGNSVLLQVFTQSGAAAPVRRVDNQFLKARFYGTYNRFSDYCFHFL